MPELPPTTARKPADPDEPERTDQHDGPPISASFTVPNDIETGTLIAGKYKLLEAIGEGGMGAVWMAQQIEPVKRHVALKLIKSGMDSKSVVARFEAERQALSMMDHPNIARVFDVGTTATGRPYFVMELVKGTPITDFCDQRKLTPRQRLELFIPVCLAIQHAHQKGIIHRDIKPSNVLVALHDDKPVPKVIDFGVAKATGTPLTEKTLHTGFEQVVGTPAYMSPEQATFNQLDIDTRSDVYSLGVLLYELLTGTTPIERERFKQAAILEMLRVVREEEPPRPSTRLSSVSTKATIAASRNSEPARLSKEFKGELDWIALRALEKDRTRRYETVDALSRDVQRYLADEVVEARPPSVAYRIRKLVRRHKGRFVAATMVVLALVGGVIGTTVGLVRANRAQEEEANQRRIAEDNLLHAKKREQETTLVTDVLVEFFQESDPLLVVGLQGLGVDIRTDGESTLRNYLKLSLERLNHELKDLPPLIRASLLDALGNVNRSEGAFVEAKAKLDEALRIRVAHLGESHPDVAKSLFVLGWLAQDEGRFEESQELYQRALDMFRTTLGEDHRLVSVAMFNLAWVTAHQYGDINYARQKKAELLLREILKRQAAMPKGRHCDPVITRIALLLVLNANGEANKDEAVTLVAELTLQLSKSPHGATIGSAMVKLYEAERLRTARKFGAAVLLIKEVRDGAKKLLGENHPLMAYVHGYLAGLMRDSGDWEGAKTEFAITLRIGRRHMPQGHWVLAKTMIEAGGWLRDHRDFEESETMLRDALEMAKRCKRLDLWRQARGELLETFRVQMRNKQADSLRNEPEPKLN